ncbi:MAG: 3-phosphoshikimate 1-carboxyvinyltransferase [Planctomycetes bacterium]|nr:3-phosphoshikimate 1-carboxyvinyltransferase [Planctomycetota bacterium]
MRLVIDNIPGDKSIAQRAVLLAAIASGTSHIRNYPDSDDCRAALECVKELGVRVKMKGDSVTIKGRGLYGLRKPTKPLNVGESGTLARLLSGLLAAQPFSSTLTGRGSLLNRPMKRVIDPLRLMGANISSPTGSLPIHFQSSKRLSPIRYPMPLASAQVKSALLLAGLYANGVTTIKEPTPTRDHTERLLKLMGATITLPQRHKEHKGLIKLYPPERLKPFNITLPGDISSAAYFIVAGILLPIYKETMKPGHHFLASWIPYKELVIRNVGLNPHRIGILDVLKRMGADCKLRIADCGLRNNWEPVGDIIVKPSRLKAITLGGRIIPSIIDEIPLIAVLATQAKGITIIKDAGELRVKESDRIKAIADGLRRLGANIRELKDGLVIKGPTPLHGAVVDSYNDHRIAMSLIVAGLVTKGRVVVKNRECINKSFPEFSTRIKQIERIIS